MAIFGSIQQGSAARFSSKNKPALSPFQPDVSQAQLQSPPAPGAYSKLPHGPEFEVEFERNQTPAVDGSNDLLRTLSPFMIQVEPPLVYAGLDQEAKTNLGDILAAGHRGAPSAFQAARNRIRQDIPGGGLLSNSGSVEQVVANGFRHRQTGASRTQVKKPGDVNSGGSSGRIGQPAIADLNTAVDITMQLRGLLDTPPLVLLINPQTLTMSRSKVQQYSDRSRFGFIFQAWGEEQPKLSINARCGAFVSGGRGVQWASRRDSASWQNLANAFRFYKHNGYIYDTVGKSNAHHFVGALSIHYDGWIYYGSMESFNYTYEEGNQLGGVAFDMEFVVNAVVDTSRVGLLVSPMQSPVPSRSDRRYFGQQAQAIPSGATDVRLFGRGGLAQVGGDTFQSLADVEQGREAARQRSAAADALAGGAESDTPAGPAASAVARNRGGFQAVAPVQVDEPAAPSRPVTPFGLSRR